MKNVASIFSEDGKKRHRHYATAIYTFSLKPLRNGRQLAPEPIKGAGCVRLANEKAPTGMFGRVVFRWNVQPLASSQTFQGNTIADPNRPQRCFLSAWQAPVEGDGWISDENKMPGPP